MPIELTHNRPLPYTYGPAAGEGQCFQVRPDYDKRPWLSSITSIFVHGGWAHLLGNMLFLWVFGNNVEDRFGRLRFLLFYLLVGVLATYVYAFARPDATEPLVGASGAISGVLGAYLLLFPRAKVLGLVSFLFFFPLRLPAWVVLGFYFVLQAFYAYGVGMAGGGAVAYLVHVVGFALGAGRRAGVRRRAATAAAPAPGPLGVLDRAGVGAGDRVDLVQQPAGVDVDRDQRARVLLRRQLRPARRDLLQAGGRGVVGPGQLGPARCRRRRPAAGRTRPPRPRPAPAGRPAWPSTSALPGRRAGPTAPGPSRGPGWPRAPARSPPRSAGPPPRPRPGPAGCRRRLSSPRLTASPARARAASSSRARRSQSCAAVWSQIAAQAPPMSASSRPRSSATRAISAAADCTCVGGATSMLTSTPTTAPSRRVDHPDAAVAGAEGEHAATPRSRPG